MILPPRPGVLGFTELVVDTVVRASEMIPAGGDGLVRGEITRSRGGSVANTLALLGLLGLDARAVTLSGADEGGVFARSELRSEGVRSHALVGGRTIQSVCQVKGDRRLMVVDGAGRRGCTPSELRTGWRVCAGEECGVVYTNLSLLDTPAGETLAALTQRAGALLCVSLSSATRRGDVSALLEGRGVGLVLGNAREGERAGAGELAERGITCVLTDGAGPVQILGEERVEVASAAIEVEDGVGAGDGFAAGVLGGLSRGMALGEAVARGAHLGARMCQLRGAQHPRDEESIEKLRGLLD